MSLWDYGYPGRWGGWRGGPTYIARPYTEGTIIIDVVDARTKALLWRGRGRSATSDDPMEFQKSIRHAVLAIVKKFPAGANRVALSQ